MITKLTKKQEKNVQVYLNRWLDLGRSTKTMNKEKAKEAVTFFYSMMSKEVPKDVHFVKSPLEANLLIHKLRGKSDKEKVTYEYFTRSILWIGYYGFYDYVLNELFPKKKKDFTKFTDFLKHSKEVFGCYLFDTVAIICDFPEQININSQGQLHGNGKGSMVFRDGYSIYNLNGIAVPKDIAMIKDTDITKDMIIKQENADIRREIIRKLEPSKLIKVLDAVVMDSKNVTINRKKHKYELLNISINGDRDRPFLKMTNPSLKNVVHVEGVSPECKTVEDAIKFRNGLTNFVLPEDLS